MRRIGFWLAVLVTSLALLSLLGFIAAVRWWPKQTISRLPLASLVMVHTVADPAGRSLIKHRLYDKAAEPIITRALNGSVASQRQMVGILAGSGFGFYRPPKSMQDRVTAMTLHADQRLRTSTRCMLSPVDIGLKWNDRHPDGKTEIDHARPLGPGSWIPEPVAVRALLALTFLGAGYDHRTPNKYKNRVASLIADLRSHQDDQGRFASDGSDHAIVLMAIAEAYAMSNDPALKRPVQAGIDYVLREDDGGPESRWSADTLLSCWDLAAQKSAAAGGLKVDMERTDAWMRSNQDFGMVWRESGHEITVDAQDLLAHQAMFSLFLNDRSILMAMNPELLVPRPESSECIRMWLCLSLFVRTNDFFSLVAGHRDRLVNEQEWDPAHPDFGSMAPGDPGAHALRVLTAEIYCRYSP